LKGRITIDKERCKGCGLCILVCPMKQIEISDELNTKGYYPASFLEENAGDSGKRKCTGCALCALTCPDVAIEVYRETKKSNTAKSNEDVSADK
jgi:2-oxoglutarate ferredoxin oxidoreductase subunit delta